MGGDLSTRHHHSACGGGYAGAFAGARRLRREREDEAVGLTAGNAIDHHLEAAAGAGDAGLAEQLITAREDVGDGKVDGHHGLPVDHHRLVAAGARADHVLCQVEVGEGEDDAEVGCTLEAREEGGQRDGLGVGIGVDGEGSDVAEGGLDGGRLTALFELPHMLELAVEEERDLVEHGEDSVLDDGCALLGFAAMDVHDVDAFDLLHQHGGAERDEEVGEARRVAHADEGGHAGGLGVGVEREHLARGGEVIADVDVAHLGGDGGAQDGRAELVEGAHAVEDAVGARHHGCEACAVEGIEGCGLHARATYGLHHLFGCFEAHIGDDELRHIGLGRKRPHGHAANTTRATKYDNFHELNRCVMQPAGAAERVRSRGRWRQPWRGCRWRRCSPRR